MLITPIGNFGVAMCWEMIRYDTLKRLTGKVDIVLSGSCRWDLPIDAPPERDSLRQYNQSLACETPIKLAKLLGVPVVHASHCGKVIALNFPDADKLQTRQFVGAAQIVDGNGHILAKKHFLEGEGIIISDISWNTANRNKANDFPAKYWIPDLPASYTNAWEIVNSKGKSYYDAVTLSYYKSHRLA